MIPKIICFIFGHIKEYREFNHPLNKIAVKNGVIGGYYYRIDYKYCPRCGAKLKEKNEKR